MNSGLRVVADFGRSAQQLNQLKQWVGWLSPLSPALIGAGLVGWFVTLFLLWRGDQQMATTLLVIVIVVSFGAVAVPRWVEGFSAEITQHIQRRTAQEKLTFLLEKYLDGNWTLYHQLPSGDQFVSLLVGKDGIYLLDLLFSDQTAQVTGDKWLFRDAEDEWDVAQSSPTRLATEKAIQLQRRLSKQDITVFVQPRVVWAGEGMILLDEPTIPVWWLAQVEGMVKDLRDSERVLSAETITQIHSALEKIIEERNASPRI